MSHLVAFPEDIYQAIAKYAAGHGQTAEDVIFAWGKAIKEQVVDEKSEEAVYNPADDHKS